MFADDAGYADFGFTGHPTIRTPHLDRLAAEGMVFTQFYSGAPVCTPSRYALLTGREPRRSGIDEAAVLFPKSRKGIHEREITVAELLREQGYATAIFGKWHLGVPNENNGYATNRLPLSHGFDEYFGLPYSNDMIGSNVPPIPLLEGPVVPGHERYKGYRVVEFKPDQKTIWKRYTEHAVDFVRRNSDRPFFLYLPFSMPHIPLHPGEDFVETSRRGKYGDVIEEIDWSVGQIVNEVRRLGISDRTLVIFTSDNGPWLPFKQDGGSAGMFRDGKGTTWEGGMHVPCVAWWPGVVPANRKNMVPASVLDLLPTAAELSGAALPSDRVIDGRSIVSLLRGSEEFPDRPIFYMDSGGKKLFAVRYGPWKLKVKMKSNATPAQFKGKEPLLFNIEIDPGEQWNLADKHPDIVQQLLKMIEFQDDSVEDEGTFWD
ncbi:MAG: sulfatase [Armatimonadetes bacterium]|nr:sulfatase [Armatimonadota bacterium]